MIDLDDFIIKTETSGQKRKLYLCTCDHCGKVIGYKPKRFYRSGLCKMCFGHIKHTGRIFSEETKNKMKNNHYISNGGDHPWKGRNHSEETKKKLSQKQKEYCEKYGNQFITGKSHGQHSKKTIEQISANNTGKEPKWRGRIFLYDGPQGRFKLRSSYELFYAQWLDSQGIKWQYEPHFKLSNGKTFSPDFKLDGGDIIEVKGYWTKIGRAKWDLFCADYPDIPKKILTKTDLIIMGMKGK
jgi:predicted nuclease of restriction endonuclease-like RecB superfamily